MKTRGEEEDAGGGEEEEAGVEGSVLGGSVKGSASPGVTEESEAEDGEGDREVDGEGGVIPPFRRSAYGGGTQLRGGRPGAAWAEEPQADGGDPVGEGWAFRGSGCRRRGG